MKQNKANINGGKMVDIMNKMKHSHTHKFTLKWKKMNYTRWCKKERRKSKRFRGSIYNETLNHNR